MNPVSLSIVLAILGQLMGRVKYGLGSKAAENPFFHNILTSLLSLAHIDCSGFVRLVLYRATGGKLKLPDGSQNQREWCERMALIEGSGVRKVRYDDAARYMTEHRLFICFIKPFENGCGSVGHVWLLLMRKGKAMTVESHGGTHSNGVDSRDWDYPVLHKQVFSCYELLATK